MARGAPFEHTWPGLGLQQAGSFVEGLTARPFHEVAPASGEAGFAWMRTLETNWATIAAELAVATKPGAAAAALERKGRSVWAAAARADAAGYGPEWRTLVLQDRGRWDPANAALFPQTVRIVRDAAAAPSVECFFARQAPGSGIKPHTDNCNFVMTAHLGLDVPEGKCWLKARALSVAAA
jgi:aspartate beta-hydroxylase